MVAYTVGMVTGTVCMVMPLVYAMNINRCIATILASQPTYDQTQFAAYLPTALVYGISVVGAIVLLLSAMLMARAAYGGQQSTRPKPQTEPEPEPAPEPTEEPEPADDEEPAMPEF